MLRPSDVSLYDYIESKVLEVVLLMLEVSGISQVVIWFSPSRRMSGVIAWNDELTATSNGSVPLRPFKRRD